MRLSQKFNNLYNKIILQSDSESKLDFVKMIEEIKQIFNTKDLKINENLISKIYVLSKRLFNGTDAQNLLLEALLKQIKLNKHYAEEIVEDLSNLVSTTTLNALATYISNSGQRLNIDDYIGRKIKFTDLLAETKLPESGKLFQYLYNKEFNKIPKMGRSELFCAIVFRSGKKEAGKSGDVQIGSDELQVKAGISRLGGQKRIW